MKPKIYLPHEHRISVGQIDPHATFIIQKLKEGGHTAYLVGGGVRDLLLGEVPKDFDISTSAKPEEIKRILKNAILIGRRFRLAHVRFGRQIFEVSTFRSGDSQAAELIVQDNVWGSEEEDVLRRDFTINGLFYDPQTETVIDYVGGMEDIEQRILRTIGEPSIRFNQDPVRMIRLIKFCARFDLTIDPPTFDALLRCRNEIIKSSPVRILEELLRMLESSASKRFFHLLHEYGLLDSLLPELALFFREEPENSILQLLEQIDSEVLKQSPKPIDRSLLLTALIFPLFYKRLQALAPLQKKPPHLGQITNEAYTILDETFQPFFSLPRRLKSMTASILISQCRLTPLDGRQLKKPKIPKDPLFPFALEFLKLRSRISPHLLSVHTTWTEALLASGEPIHPPSSYFPPKKRKRRRRSRSIETSHG